MQYPRLTHIAVPLWACVLAVTAQAQDTPPLTLSASYALQTDDNLARLPGSGSDRADQIGTTTVGVLFHTIQGLQRFELQASLVNYQYQTHRELDYTARNYAAAWHWAITPRLRGNLTGDQSEMPGANFGNTQPNQQKRNNYRLDAEYEIDGPWHVASGLARDRVESQTVDATGTQFSVNSLEAGLRYDARSGSTATYSAKASDGTYLNSNPAPLSFIDDRYQQLDNDARVHWAVSANSSVDLNATYIDRRHPTYGLRDFSGLNYGSRLNWSVSAKTTLMLAYARELAAYATYNSNYSDTDHLAWAWNWQTSAHTRFQLHQDYQQIAYGGSPFGGAGSTRKDRNRDTSIAWIWQPRSQWQFSAELHQISRDSSDTWLSYTSNQARLSGQFSY